MDVSVKGEDFVELLFTNERRREESNCLYFVSVLLNLTFLFINDLTIRMRETSG